VQSLVGNASWSSVTRSGKFYHVGTIPNKKSNTFVSDLRMMVTGNMKKYEYLWVTNIDFIFIIYRELSRIQTDLYLWAKGKTTYDGNFGSSW
jgi:N6-adenosine-specific RNA methylase IME4